MQTLYLSLLPNNWIKIKSKASTKPQFMEIIDNLRKIPVIRFDNKDKSYISSIFFIDHIYKLAEKYGYQVYETENLDYYIQRFKLKMERIKQEKQNTQFNSKYWTDDLTIRYYHTKHKQLMYHMLLNIICSATTWDVYLVI